MNGFWNVVLTGASGGLGQALAAELAGPGKTMLLMGRDMRRLEAAAHLVEAWGVNATVASVPIQDHAGVVSAIRAFDEENPIDLFIANAGVKSGNVDGIEDSDDLRRVVDVNLTGTINAVQSVLPGMLVRGAGRIAIVSSLAARSPQGCLLSYSATKSGLDAYATALRRRCHGTGVSVSLVVPGFIDTPMTDRHLGPSPLKMTAKAAARRTVRGLQAGRDVIAFPRLLHGLALLQNLLPRRLSDRIAISFDADILPDRDGRLP